MAKLEITPGIEIMDLGLWLPAKKILVFSDFHIGYEEALNRRGILLPRLQLKDTLDRLKKIFAELGQKPNLIIINGDLKHEFGTVSREEFFGVRDLLNLLAKNSKKIIIVRGNHDKTINYTLKQNVKIVSSLLNNDVLFTHGDSANSRLTKAKTIIIGHIHPTIKLTEGSITEKVKCFLKGTLKGKTIIVLPSFNLVTEGADILSEKNFSPYTEKMKNTEAWAVPEFNKALYFGETKYLL